MTFSLFSFPIEDDDETNDDDDDKACSNKITRLSKFGVPTKSCISNLPGRIIAASKALETNLVGTNR